MKRQRKTTEVLDWEELEGAPNTHGAFSFLRPQGTIINIEEHRQQETAASPDAEVNIQTKTSTVDDLSSVERHLALRRPYKVHRCYRAQDAHSHGENQLYAALWHAGVPDGPETKRVIMGWDRMARQAGMSDKAAKRNLKQLRDKLAVELLEVENSATRTGRTYRIYSFRAILERRNAAGLHFVVRDKGVRFVQAADIESAGNIDEGEVTNKTSTVDRTSTVDKTTTGTVDKTSRDTVDKTSTPLGSSLGSKDRKTTTTGEDLTPIVNALSSYAVADEDAA
jgi:cell wall assembly regulator SMI1